MIRPIALVALGCLTLLAGWTAPVAADTDRDFVTVLYDLPLGQNLDMPDYLTPTDAVAGRDFWFYKGGLDSVNISDLMVKRSTMAIFRLELTAGSARPITEQLLPAIRDMYPVSYTHL
ncbi:MAG: hypothetical protein N3A57_02395, partial [Negativicutes bacterium]|nr:hypothetical protein [Negativicutes bacterium]